MFSNKNSTKWAIQVIAHSRSYLKWFHIFYLFLSCKLVQKMCVHSTKKEDKDIGEKLVDRNDAVP